MVKREIKHTYHPGPPQKVGNVTLPGHGNTEHPYTRHPNRSEPTTTGSAPDNTPELTPEKRGGRKSNRRKKTMKKKRKTRKAKKSRRNKRV